jgi:pilus assembly protein Flp/PilA
MGLLTSKIRIACHALRAEEDGQDLIEYAMIVALLALGAVAGMDSVSSAISAIFVKLSAILGGALG